MLHHRTDAGTILVSQPAHAWISGQLAAAWGNAGFGVLEPFAEMCLAAEQHDIGWLEWEAAPTLNPATGLPRTFMDLPTLEHVAVWAPAGPRALVYGPYVALLVSLHGTGLYQRHDFTRDTLEEAEAARQFTVAGATFEEGLLKSMAGHERYDGFIATEIIHRSRRLVAVWDALSLALCQGIDREYEIANVPTATNSSIIKIQRIDAKRFNVHPWPFADEALNLVCAGRLLEGSFTSEDDMRAAIEDAPWTVLEFDIVRGGEPDSL